MSQLDEKPYAPACERNQEPIRAALARILTEPATVLEIGSGTGQHGVYFARHLPHLQWQLTDVADNVPGIRLWQSEAALPNLPAPRILDLMAPVDLNASFDAVFTANTVHFISWSLVRAVLRVATRHLRDGGDLLIYGPFNEEGRYTSEGNAALDEWLQSRDPDSGIKDRSEFEAVAGDYGLEPVAVHTMPANNLLLHLTRS